MRFVHFRLVGPAVAGLALLIAGLATFPYFGVRQIDAAARQKQETLVERNIALWTTDIEFSLTAWTIWDESIAKIDNSFDFDWTDRNIGESLIGTSRTRFAAVLDRSDALIYSRTKDTVQDRPFFARGSQAIIADASPLVADVRTREAIRKHAPATEGIPKPIALSRIEVLGDEAVLLTASLFQPDFGTAKPTGERAPILVTAMPLGSSLQEFFGTRFLLDDARVSPLSAVGANRARAEIAVGPHGETEVLSWRPPTPAVDILKQSLPLILTVGLILVAGGGFLIYISQATAQMLVGREQQMRHAATHDFLTGLANRALLEPEFRMLAEKGPLAVACIDLDGFKAVNDTHGHAAGDELLREVAARLRAGTRKTDRLFRLGGDEFALLMPGIATDEAAQLCRQLAFQLSKPIALPACSATIGASFGISELLDRSTNCDDALKAADAALYRAKAAGRGGVVTASEMCIENYEADGRRVASARR